MLRYGGRMAGRTLSISLLLPCALVPASCAETLDVPPAPEFEDVLAAYANPTAEVSSAIMAAVADELLALRDQLEESEVFDEILDVIVDVQVELDANTDEKGNLVVPGLGTFPAPNAVLEINHNCPGWNPNDAGDSAETSGSVQLTMVLDLGDIRPVVWGEAAQCQFSAIIGERALQSKYDGEIAVHFGHEADSPGSVGDEPISTSEPLRDLVATFILLGTLEVEGEQLEIRRSFRVRDGGGIEILWELGSEGSFVYVFNPGTGSEQWIIDANCPRDVDNEPTCGCKLEERECTLTSGSISW